MLKQTSNPLSLLLAACVAVAAQDGRPRPVSNGGARAPLVVLDSTREGDGLKGPVRRVETEVVKVEMRQGRLREHPPSLLERTLYDERGRRVENETYPVVGNRAGQETHRYDARGNVVETIVRDAGGAALSRTTYEYEFDAHGNWTRMTASVAVSNQGRVEYEPVEVTRRAITYYLVEGAGARRPSGSALAPPVAAGERVGERAAPPTAAEGRKASASDATGGGELLSVGVLNERATWLPKPAFPVGPRRLDVPVTVAVEVTLDITGRVVEARARGGPRALCESAERAARRAAFLPFYVSGRPVRARGIINYDFNYLP